MRQRRLLNLKDRIISLAEALLYIALLGLFAIYMLPTQHSRMIGLVVWALLVAPLGLVLLAYWMRQRACARQAKQGSQPPSLRPQRHW